MFSDAVRKDVLARVGFVVALAFGAAFALGPAQAGNEGPLPSREPNAAASVRARPNILVILTDDQRSGLRAMPATARIFRNQGVAYRGAYVADPLCCPSRASIMTGRYPHNTGARSNAEHPELGVSGALALDQSTTIQRYLHDAGYATALVGKYLNRWDFNTAPPYFDTFAMIDKNYVSPHVSTGTAGAAPHVYDAKAYATTFVRRRALRFLRSNADPRKPFFLYVAPIAPHTPFTPEPKYANDTFGRWNGNPATTESDLSDKPPYVRDSRPVSLATARKTRTAQFRTLESVDDMVASIFRRLRGTGQARNTLAFFMSDNGYMWGEHSQLGKDVPYLPSVEVPFFARWPAGPMEAGTADSRGAANVDIAPTILDAVGLTVPAAQPPMDGRSLLQGWTRTREETEHWCNVSRCLYWSAERTRRYHYIEYYDGPDFDTANVVFREYYDLANDPFELRNLLHDGNPANDPDVAPIAAQLAADRSCVGMTCP